MTRPRFAGMLRDGPGPRTNGAIGLFAALAIAMTAAAVPFGPGTFNLFWHTVDGGGATFSNGGGFTLGGSIGQPDAGVVMSGGQFQVIGGFWLAATSGAPLTCAADLNHDGLVNGADLGLLLGNWGGTGLGDLTGDGSVNGADLGILLGAWGDCPG
ncbi:MAG: hypothetical protein U0575_15160 [Phycisphaerales bacterium]